MNISNIHKILLEHFGDEVIFDFIEEDTMDPWINVNHEHIQTVCAFLRYNPKTRIAFLSSISGVDWPERNQIHIVYHLFSPESRHPCVLKTAIPRNRPKIESLESVWKAANWFEREIFDLFGVEFVGHSNLKRLMLPEDWEGHPLRKDYQEKEIYHDMATTRPDPLKVLRGKNA